MNTKNSSMLTIQNLDYIQQAISCNSTRSCKINCSITCKPNQVCAYQAIKDQCNSNSCLGTICVDVQPQQQQLKVLTTDLKLDPATDTKNDHNKQTALIAGLTTGLVAFALVIVTIAGFIYYKHRKKRLKKNKSINDASPIIVSEINSILPPPPPTATISILPPISENSIISSSTQHWSPIMTSDYSIIDYEHPHSPFIIGAQSLQIPHLDSPNPNLTRRSLHIQSTTDIRDIDYINRSFSVKITKYDHRCPKLKVNPIQEEEIEGKVISVKKNNSADGDKKMVTRPSIIISKDANMDLEDQQQPFYVTLNDPSIPNTPTAIQMQNLEQTNNNDDRKINLYFYPPSEDTLTLRKQSQCTIQSSNSTSTLADGEITVYLEQNPSY